MPPAAAVDARAATPARRPTRATPAAWPHPTLKARPRRRRAQPTCESIFRPGGRPPTTVWRARPHGKHRSSAEGRAPDKLAHCASRRPRAAVGGSPRRRRRENAAATPCRHEPRADIQRGARTPPGQGARRHAATTRGDPAAAARANSTCALGRPWRAKGRRRRSLAPSGESPYASVAAARRRRRRRGCADAPTLPTPPVRRGRRGLATASAVGRGKTTVAAAVRGGAAGTTIRSSARPRDAPPAAFAPLVAARRDALDPTRGRRRRLRRRRQPRRRRGRGQQQRRRDARARRGVRPGAQRRPERRVGDAARPRFVELVFAARLFAAAQQLPERRSPCKVKPASSPTPRRPSRACSSAERKGSERRRRRGRPWAFTSRRRLRRRSLCSRMWSIPLKRVPRSPGRPARARRRPPPGAIVLSASSAVEPRVARDPPRPVLGLGARQAPAEHARSPGWATRSTADASSVAAVPEDGRNLDNQALMAPTGRATPTEPRIISSYSGPGSACRCRQSAPL